MKILAIESSCDETAAAVVENGRTVLSSVVASQVEEHKIYGGVVPEIASRRHAEAISGVVGKEPFVIDRSKCIKCGMCMSSCKFFSSSIWSDF